MAEEFKRFKKFGAGAAMAASAAVLSFALLSNGAGQAPLPSLITPAYARDAGYLPGSFADLVQKVRPAVVSINVKNGGRFSKNDRHGDNGDRRERNYGLPDLPKDNPLYDFFKRFGERLRPHFEQPRFTRAEGSGFLISADGYIVTNNHVVKDATTVTVVFDQDKKEYDAKVIGTDPRTDLALLKISGKTDFPHLKFADHRVRVGDWVLAVGNPFGLGGSVTAGIVSARGRDLGSSPYDYLQIDAAVNRGNSGGPAINLDGEVVGVNTAIFSPSGGNVGIAFSIPADLAQKVVGELKAHGAVRRGWLGVSIQSVTKDLAEGLGMDAANPSGALVTNVLPEGPAAGSPIKVGDVITQVNGADIEDSRDLARKVAAIPPDTKTKIVVFRKGKTETFDIKLGTFPNSQKFAALQSGESSGAELDDLGLVLEPADKPGADDKGAVIVDVQPGSPADEKGLRRGDVIVEVGNEPVSTPEDVADGVHKAREAKRKAVIFQIRRNNQSRFVALALENQTH